MAPKFSKMADPNPKKKIQARPGGCRWAGRDIGEYVSSILLAAAPNQSLCTV